MRTLKKKREGKEKKEEKHRGQDAHILLLGLVFANESARAIWLRICT
jgi:hypothetical protein